MSKIKKIHLKIATPERLVLEEKEGFDRVILPTTEGEVTILPGHISFIATLSSGIIQAKKDNGKIFPMAVSGGFFELKDNFLTILADTAEHAHEIDLERAEKARIKAQELKRDREKIISEEQFATMLSGIEKQNARIKLAKKYRPKGSGSMIN